MQNQLVQRQLTLEFNSRTAIKNNSDNYSLVIPMKYKSREPANFQAHELAKQEHIYDLLLAKNNLAKYNIGHVLTTKQLDIDFDYARSEETDLVITQLIRCFEYYMPKTPYRFGRKSKYHSHWIYCLHEEYKEVKHNYKHISDFLSSLEVLGIKLPIEIRTRNQPNEMMISNPGPTVLMPGSMHPDNELLEWHEDITQNVTPTLFSANEIMRSLVKACITLLLINFWNEPFRQKMCLALSSAFYSYNNAYAKPSKKLVKDMVDDDENNTQKVVLNKEDFEHILEGICHLTDDTEVKMRIRAFQQTWDKRLLDLDIPMVGIPTLLTFLGENGQRIADNIFMLISGVVSNMNVEKIRSTSFLIEGTGNMIDASQLKTLDNYIMNKQQHKNSYGSVDLRHNGRLMKLTEFIYNSKLITRVKGVDFEPPEKLTLSSYNEPEYNYYFTSDHKANLYRHFDVSPCKKGFEDNDLREISPFLEYIDTVFCSNKVYGDYIFSFLANIVQNPRHRHPTYLILIGEPGCGKSFLFQHFMTPILGRRYVLITPQINDVFGNFNSQIANKVLVVFEEAITSERRATAQLFKQFITGDTVTLNMKFRDSYQIKNYARSVLISNYNEEAAFLDWTAKERRAVVIEARDTLCGNTKYWDSLYEWSKDKTNLAKVHRYLLDYPINYTILMKGVVNEEKARLQYATLANSKPIVLWLLEKITEDKVIDNKENWFDCYYEENDNQDKDNLSSSEASSSDKWPNRVYTKAIMNDYKKWIKDNGYPPRLTRTPLKQIQEVLGDKFRKVGQVKIKDSFNIEHKPTMYSFPSKQELIDHLKAKYGYVIQHELEEAEK